MTKTETAKTETAKEWDDRRLARENCAHITREILTRWVAARPNASAEVVSGLADQAVSAAVQIHEVCSAVAEDPKVRAKRLADEAEKAQKAAAKQARQDKEAAERLAALESPK